MTFTFRENTIEDNPKCRLADHPRRLGSDRGRNQGIVRPFAKMSLEETWEEGLLVSELEEKGVFGERFSNFLVTNAVTRLMLALGLVVLL